MTPSFVMESMEFDIIIHKRDITNRGSLGKSASFRCFVLGLPAAFHPRTYMDVASTTDMHETGIGISRVHTLKHIYKNDSDTTALYY